MSKKNRYSFPISLLALATLLGGCASLEPTLPEANAQIANQWDAATDEGPAAIDIGWREFFVDPDLTALIGQALENNRDLRIAILNVDRARAIYRIQNSERFPRVGASASVARLGGDGQPPGTPSETYRVELGIAEYEIDLFGRVRTLSDAALQRYLATEEAQVGAQLTLIAEVANAYLTLVADHELQRIAQATLESFEAEFELVEHRNRLGAASSLELAQARSLVEQARVDTARFAGQVALDVNALTLLVGQPVDPSRLSAEFKPQSDGLQPLPAGLPSDTLLRRPDIRQAELLLRAANADIGAARAAFFPSITLTGALGSTSQEFSDLLSSGSESWSFTPRIGLPIFQAGRLRANRDAAIADRDIALAQYERAIQSGFREIADSLALSQTLQQQSAAQERLLEAAAEAQRLSQARYEGGQTAYFVLLDSQRALYAARQALVATQLAEQSNRTNLYKFLGGGWNADGGQPLPATMP